MFIRSKAPLRLGLAGGGTDTSPYSDIYGGAILNATLSLYAYASIEPRTDGKICLNSIDQKQTLEMSSSAALELNNQLDLLKGVYNRVVKDYVKKPLSFTLTTYVDVPPGSGLGSSSTLVAAMLGAFVEWQELPLGEYDIAHLAYEIERQDLKMSGGKQDQYAATFGGFNFMEFSANDRVIVNPLRIKRNTYSELEFSILLYDTGTSRLSSKIIEAQTNNVLQKQQVTLDSMNELKEQAYLMKEALLKGKLEEFGPILDQGWVNKKKVASAISNPVIDEIYDAAKKVGATGGKISGAGGGGFMMFYCPQNTRYEVINELKRFGGEFRRFQFTQHGLRTWKAKR
jgi:D-glycero-alpha-D-manno-heptose-7-phosphate kinase